MPERPEVKEDKRGYFYESVGGVYYTLDWPLRSNSSLCHELVFEDQEVFVRSQDADSGQHSMNQQDQANNLKDSSKFFKVKIQSMEFESAIVTLKFTAFTCITFGSRHGSEMNYHLVSLGTQV